jgi:K319-like protein
VADAGPDQAITVIGTVVHLNGSQSYSPSGLPITYQWSFVSKPVGSNATLTGPTTATPSFVADVHGDYSIQLIVTDSLGTASSPATVKVSFNNIAPIANAGLSQSAVVGQTVTLNGSGSSDANGDPLTYKWSLTSVPTGSQAVIANPTAQIASFVPDLPGTFVAQLIVNDGFVDSLPATVEIQVVSRQTQVTMNIESLQQNVIATLAPSAFKNATMQNALLNKLNAVIASIEACNYSDALAQLQNDILAKTDGCATSGAPDKNDWITNCTDQSKVYPLLLNIIAEVKALSGG